MRATAILIAIAFFSALAAQTPFACLSSDESTTVVEFVTPDFQLQTDPVGQHIDLGDLYAPYGAGPAGLPDVPAFSRLVCIPAGTIATAEVETLDEEVLSDVLLLPCRNLDAMESGDDTYHFDSAAYASSKLYPAQTVSVSDPGVMRQTAVARLTIQPFRYNAASRELHVARRLRITLRYAADSRGKTPRLAGAGSPAFCELLASCTLNPPMNTGRSYEQPGSYIYVYNGSNVLPYLQPLVSWRERQGYEVHLLDSSTVNNTTNNIKAYIQNAYDTWENPPEFVCLVGDATQNYSVPTWFEEFESMVHGDHPYSQLDGDDLFPDVLVGRLTFNSFTQLQTIVSKILCYEITPPTQNDWLDRALLVGDPYSSGASTVSTMLYVRDLYNAYNPSGTYDLVIEFPIISQIQSALNNGVGAYFYRGFGTFSDWLDEYTNALTNYSMTPFMSAITCYTGNFATSIDSPIEVFLKAGSPSIHIGAVGVVGSSSATHTCFNNIITAGIAEAIYVEGVHSMAAALDRGKLALYESYPSNPNDYVDWYTIGKNFLGDPGTWLRTRQADSLFVTADAVVPLGSTVFQATVTNADGLPVADVWVTAQQDDNVAGGYTNENGVAMVYFGAATAGEVLLTASAPDCVPWLGSFVVEQTDDFVSFEDYALAGNFWPGEHAVNVTICNQGGTYLPGAGATVRCADPYFVITDSLLSFGAMAAGQSVTSTNAFTGTLAADVPWDHVVTIQIDIATSWDIYTTWFQMPVERACVEMTDMECAILPGQAAPLNITLNNASEFDIPGAQLTLTTLSSNITIISSSATMTNLTAGAEAIYPFQVMANADCVVGQTFRLYLHVEGLPQVYQTLDVELTIGTPGLTDPTGPDEYGYWIYDSGDTSYPECPTYNWVEIDPNHGGQGTVLPLVDNDYEGWGDMITVDLPFTFRFYEMGYDRLAISSNGFLMPGEGETIEWLGELFAAPFEWMNWPIPGPMVPRPIIAPFWDDLIIGDASRVITWFDEPNHCYIVEWAHLLNRYDDSEETFQALLYDPAYNATYLNDSKILFQYNVVNNVDEGTYIGDYLDHGEYSTVGIGDHTGLRGLQYTYSNRYPATAAPLADGLALLVTGPPTPPSQAYVVLDGATIVSDDNHNGLIDSGETIGMQVNLRNLGLETATDVTAQLVTSDPYLTIQQGTTTYPSLAFGQSSSGTTTFGFMLANGCPNNHAVNLSLLIQYDGSQRTLSLPLRSYAPDLALGTCAITDDNDNQLAPGETGTMNFSIHRLGYHVVHNATIGLSCNTPGVSFSPSEFSIPLMEGDSLGFSCSITVDDDVMNGIEIPIDISMDYNTCYHDVEQYTYVVGAYEILMQDDFNDGMDPDVWRNFDAAILNTGYAGGDGQEAVFTCLPTSQRLMLSEYQVGGDIVKARVDFRHRAIGSGTYYGLLVVDVQTNNSAALYLDTAGMDEPAYEHIEFVPPFTLYDNWYIAFIMNPGSNGQMWAIDDFRLQVIRHAPTHITGTVTLQGGEGDVTQAVISNGDFSVHPDETGYYELPSYEGFFNIDCSLDGYLPITVENVNVTYDDPPVLDFTLTYLPGPFNLTYQLDDTQITLNWEYEGDRAQARKPQVQNRASGTRELDYFDVILFYRNNFYFHVYTTNTTYTRNTLAAGSYEFWIVAHHVGGGVSAESNHVSFEYLSAGEDPQPHVFGLAQCRPNPFNPETIIGYSLDESTRCCRLAVYNIRGELVRTLVNDPREPGDYTVLWDGRDDHGGPVASGVYFYRLDTGRKTAVRKAVMLK